MALTQIQSIENVILGTFTFLCLPTPPFLNLAKIPDNIEALKGNKQGMRRLLNLIRTAIYPEISLNTMYTSVANMREHSLLITIKVREHSRTSRAFE